METGIVMGNSFVLNSSYDKSKECLKDLDEEEIDEIEE